MPQQTDIITPSDEKPRLPVVLVGMMGAGKSTLGRLLAKRLGRPFIDCDKIIEQEAGKSISAIFADEGEAAFRRFEREAMARLLAREDCSVIAAGGGAMMDETTRARIKERAVSIWLKAAPERLAERVSQGTERPLLATSSKEARLAKLKELAQARDKRYAQSNYVLETDSLSPEQSLAALVRLLQGKAIGQ